MTTNLGPGQYDPRMLAQDQAKNVQAGKDGHTEAVGARQKRLAEAGNEEKQKNQLIEMLTGAAAAMSGRGVPAYNPNMANGRQGLVDPALNQQQVVKPMPWDERLASSTNLMGIQNSTRLYAPSEQVVKQVQSLTPQMQHAVKPQGTIYVQVPQDWMTNRVNLALQRRRETSVYSII